MDMATFEEQMSEFIAIIEKKKTSSYFSKKNKFIERLALFEADIKNFKRVYASNDHLCKQFDAVNDLLKQLYQATAFVGENESVFRSDDLHKQLLGKMPWIREAMGKIHTMLNK